MVFPVGGDFVRNVQNNLKVLKSDRRICLNDNGTTICDAGHKLKFPGTCLNQFIGTFNSTDASFQPTFPICSSDYQSSGFSGGTILSSDLPSASSSNYQQPVDSTEGSFISTTYSGTLSGSYGTYNTQDNVFSSVKEASTSPGVYGSLFEETAKSTVFSSWFFPQFNPGYLPHVEGAFSDLYFLDVFSSLLSYNRASLHALEAVYGKFNQVGDLSTFGNVVATDYYTTISGSVDICEGDEEPPYISYVSPPASGTRLRGTEQVVEFKLSDPLSGVALSSIYADLDSTTTGPISLLAAGADQTGGLVSVTGDSSSYTIRYVPASSWSPNDLVTVTISGADQAPLVAGNPFFCGVPEVNHFGGDLWFTVADKANLTASITVIGDVSPPYIASTVPASGTVGNNVFTPISIEIADDLTGVELGSLDISINGISVVSGGSPTSVETSITGTPSAYTVNYVKDTAFVYGSTVPITVYAEDKVSPSPNVLSSSYDISFIEDSTLIIENFLPPVGTSVNLDKVNISVDIRDDSHDINSAQSFLVVNNTIVSGTVTTIASGINIEYHPPNDFAFDGPIKVKVHAVNGNTLAPAVKEDIYNLFYGCRVQVVGETFNHAQPVEVLVKARNNESLYKDLATGYFFTTYTQPSSDFGAFINAINPVADLNASLTAQGPQHKYGQEVTVSFYVKDLEGRELGPFIYTYTIEESPG